MAEPGSFATANVAGEPVAVVRGDDGELRALSNVCRHRAMQILSGTGTLPEGAALPVPRLDVPPGRAARGRPRGARLRGARPRGRAPADVPRRVARGTRVRLAGRRGAARSPSGSATRAERLESLGIAGLRAEGPIVAEYPYNWKNLADNYLEGYHIPVGHPGLLRMLDYKRYEPQLGRRHAWISAPLRDKPSVVRRERLYQRLVRPMDGLSRPTCTGPGPTRISSRGCSSTSTPTSTTPGRWCRSAPERTMTVSWVFTPEQESFTNRVARRINWRFNDAVMDEDKTLCAGVQQGLGARTYERGVLNRNERAIAHYHDLLREMVPGIDDV